MNAEAIDARVERKTAPGPGAVAVLEVSGTGARAAVKQLAPGFRGRIHRPELVRLFRGTELLDESLAVVLEPHRIELHLHGSPAVVAAVFSALEAAGAVAVAPRGDNLESRAEAALLEAPTEAGALTLLDQSQGALREALDRAILQSPAKLASQISALRQAAKELAPALQAPRVVLFGPANAGKSTLFNLLVGSERAVVAPEAGTTRDAVREEVRLGEHRLELIDLAGERELAGEPSATARGQIAVEAQGQRLGRELAATADLILLVAPQGRPIQAPSTGLALRVHTFARARSEPAGGAGEPHIDALRDPADARQQVGEALRAALGLGRAVYRPGRAVPFEAEQLALFDQLEQAGSSAGRRRVLRASLGPRWLQGRPPR